MKQKLDTAITAILVICALLTTALLIRREFFAAPPATGKAAESVPIFVNEWETQLNAGARMGPVDAPVKLIEFADFECPYCSIFHDTLKTLRERHPEQISVTYVHYPLPMHRFAEGAARAAECASKQGRFEAMHDRLFAGQSSFGLKPWTDFASVAGVPNMEAFKICVEDTVPIPALTAGKALAEKLAINATPTLIVNGWQLTRPPSVEELERMVASVLAGKPPVTKP